jgi:hypothetical protein
MEMRFKQETLEVTQNCVFKVLLEISVLRVQKI